MSEEKMTAKDELIARAVALDLGPVEIVEKWSAQNLRTAIDALEKKTAEGNASPVAGSGMDYSNATTVHDVVNRGLIKVSKG